MNISSLFFYIFVGKLSIYFIQIFPPIKFLYKWKYLEELFSCDLCIGTWIYAFYAYFFKINFMQEWFYVPVLSEIITGAVVSFLVHLASIGWKDKFGVFEVK